MIFHRYHRDSIINETVDYVGNHMTNTENVIISLTCMFIFLLSPWKVPIDGDERNQESR